MSGIGRKVVISAGGRVGWQAGTGGEEDRKTD